MLGVLKAGGVYVPLDPQAPPDRIGYIIENCGIRVLITNYEKRRGLDAETLARLELSVLTNPELKSSNGDGVVAWGTLPEFPAGHCPAVGRSGTRIGPL